MARGGTRRRNTEALAAAIRGEEYQEEAKPSNGRKSGYSFAQAPFMVGTDTYHLAQVQEPDAERPDYAAGKTVRYMLVESQDGEWSVFMDAATGGPFEIYGPSEFRHMEHVLNSGIAARK